MPSNEQRRDAAKRTLEHRLEERARRGRRRKQLTIAGSVVGALLVVGAIVGAVTMKSDHTNAASTPSGDPDAATTSPNQPGRMPPVKPAAATVSCSYTPTPGYRGKAWKLPHTRGIKTVDNGAPITVSVSMVTSQGNIGLMLHPSESPCAVNSFASLVGQGFFDGTTCHQLTNTAAGAPDPIHALECGDPTGTGTGGPGYSFAPEYPRNQYADDDPGLQVPVGYQRGTLAMFSSPAMASPAVPQGSQFFLVFGDSQLPPTFTVLGAIDATGLRTLDRVGTAGARPVDPKTHLAPPKLPVTITSMRLDVG